jgi:hypothetical protein
MIAEILGSFRCADDLLIEIVGLANSPFATEQALAVGLVGTYWQPTRIEDAVKAMLDQDKSPVGQAKAWARRLTEAELAEVESERKMLADGLAEDFVHLLSADESEWNEAEREHVRATERKLNALGFVLDTFLDPLTDISYLNLAETG